MDRPQKQTSQSPLIQEVGKLLIPWDRRHHYRRGMDAAWKPIARNYGEMADRCVLCGKSPSWRCHVRPQEEGFCPDDNLVPLCERGSISKVIGKALTVWWRREPKDRTTPQWKKWNLIAFGSLLKELSIEEEVGCHKLLDDGFISVRTMTSVVPGRLHEEIRERALAVPMSKLDSNFGAATVRHFRLQQLKRRASSFNKGSEAWCREYCEFISTARRLSSPHRMTGALQAVQEVLPYVESNKAITDTTRSRFYYEYALTEMQRHPDPNIHYAIELLCKSITATDNPRQAATSELERIHAEMLVAQSASPILSDLEHRQDAALRAVSKDADKRWTVNQRLHRCQIRLKRGMNWQDTLTEVTSIRDARHELTLANGWTRFQAVHLACLEGMAYAQGRESEKALVALARATIVMSFGCRGKRPEGYKDIAMCAASVLDQRLGEESRRDEIRDLADRMIDGRSGVWCIA